MTADHFLGALIGYSIGAAISGLIMLIFLLRRQMWLRRADKLARQSNIALPLWIEYQVAGFLRNESLFAWLVTMLTLPVTNTVIAYSVVDQNWAKWFPWTLVGLPLYWAVLGYVLSLWPRWKASNRYRVTHLVSRSVRDAFTLAEFAALILGVVLGLALGAWGLRHVAAPATWWLAGAAAFGVGFVAWHHAAWSIMNRPSSASDEVELGWNDLLRFRQVRGFTVTVAWTPALMVFLLDCMMASAFTRKFTAPGEVGYQLVWWPILVPIVTLVLLGLVFRQGRGMWRRAWLDRTDPAS